MRHRWGNWPKCYECYWYREKEEHDGCRHDGWCTNPTALRIGINGHRRENPPERAAVMWNEVCSYWEDAEDRLTKYEAVCGVAEPWRKGLDKERVEEIIRAAKEERKR